MEIKTKDIRKIFDVIMNTIEESGNSTININLGKILAAIGLKLDL